MSDDEQWFLVFEWDAIGYVKDDEADELEAEAILGSIREATEAANEIRVERGWSPLHIVGWEEPPHYDPTTNNLTWAVIGESQGQRNINRIVKLLGRRGVMTVTLVSNPDELSDASWRVDRLLADYRFVPGNMYAEFVPGTDRLAQVGLTALVVGGAGATLAKTGLLARFWKFLVVGAAGLLGGLKKLFGRGGTAKA
jgi:uncharacterized membrane-anchored protein